MIMNRWFPLLALISGLPLSILFAHPQDPTVIHGKAQFCLTDKLIEITSTDRAIINWNGFSIGSDEIARFLQDSPHASVLNRVTGNLKSEICGSLLSNGKVFLINERGVIVGKDAIINTAEFLASTQDILDEKFLDGDLTFQGSSDAEIINLGTINTISGDAVLLASRIENRGVIKAEGGDVLLGCGYEILYKPHFDRPLSILCSPTAAAPLLENDGSIEIVSKGGKVFLEAGDGAIINVGSIHADELIAVSARAVNNSGEMTSARIDIDAQMYVDTEPSSLNAGSIHILALENLFSSGSHTAHAPMGGQILLNGASIWLCAARLDASGENQGGEISIGKSLGDITADRLYVSPSCIMTADALESGIGGNIDLWSEKNTTFLGTVSVKGISKGGFAEISCKDNLEFNGKAPPRSPEYHRQLGHRHLSQLSIH
ncbi:MAG: hypothetical protein HW387_667 [Parachlamydiales bacterium]|nr:hypothetical protein [Parachlamydiales bacterium]